MAKDPTSQDDRAAPQKGRRKPLTIDLPAAEIGKKPAGDDAASTAPVPETSAPSPPFTVADGSSATAKDSTTGARRADDPPAAKPGAPSAAADPVIPSAFATRGTERADAPSTEKSETSAGPRAAAARPRAFPALLVAALAGAAIAATVVAVLGLSGYFVPARDDGSETAAAIAALKGQVAELRQAGDGIAPLKAQVAALERSVADLSARPPAGADPVALKDVQDRLAKLESAPPQAAPGQDLAPELAALANDIAALKSAAPPDIASLQATLATLRNDIDALSARVEGLPAEERIAAIEAKLEEITHQIAAAAALAPAVAADALAAALDAGRPFASELAALKRLGVAADAVEGLAPGAEAGLPTLADLGAQFEQAIAAVPLATPIPEGAGTVDRLLQSARSLVAVRPAHPTAGSDPAATVARLRGALAAGDLKSALVEWNSLPDAVKNPTSGWAKAAEARQNADALAAEARAAALANLGAGE